jgi:aspartate carbamoyltransferase catalytic subunit
MYFEWEKNFLRDSDFLSIDDISDRDVGVLLRLAKEIKNSPRKGRNRLDGRVITNLFYEPSTRTSSSFAAAMYRLGGHVIQINDVKFSSVSKGETLPDTIRTLEQYSDAIVLRHPEIGAAATAAKYASIPIINAGDGIGEHPTQAMLDLFTIQEEVGRLDNLRVTFVGDLKHGRTVHSLIKLLDRQENIRYQTVSPQHLASSRKLMWSDELTKDILEETDVLYMTRIQKERFLDPSDAEGLTDKYVLTKELAEAMPSGSVIMHPLPRVGEIAMEVDDLPHAAYFRQAQNGMFMRMAILASLVR